MDLIYNFIEKTYFKLDKKLQYKINEKFSNKINKLNKSYFRVLESAIIDNKTKADNIKIISNEIKKRTETHNRYKTSNIAETSNPNPEHPDKKFFNKMKTKCNQKCIKELNLGSDEHPIMTNDQTTINNTFYKHFKKKFENVHAPNISNSDDRIQDFLHKYNINLPQLNQETKNKAEISYISDAEIEEAINLLKSSSAPGPDRIP